jgi:endo-1,4-beta-xylanase
MKTKKLILVLLVCVVFVSCAPASTSVPTEMPIPTSTLTVTPPPTATETVSPTITPPPDTLRAFAQRRGFLIGAAMSLDPLGKSDAQQYEKTLAREFNLVTVEHVMKFEPIHPQPEIYDFSGADLIVAFAEENQMAVRGHTLVWHNVLPAWLQDEECTRENFIPILQDHIQTVVSHYRGRVFAWDVVNEAVNDSGGLRSTLWRRCIGPDYVELAFRWAHEADPDALLFYNDYGGEGLGSRSDAIYALIKDLREHDVPIHGVGLQMHKDVYNYPDPQAITANMNRYAELGMQIHITEMDIAIDIPVTEEKITKQADIYRQTLEVCLAASNCTALIMWGFTDAQSWIPVYFQGYDEGLIFDKAYAPKPAYYALKDVLSK